MCSSPAGGPGVPGCAGAAAEPPSSGARERAELRSAPPADHHRSATARSAHLRHPGVAISSLLSGGRFGALEPGCCGSRWVAGPSQWGVGGVHGGGVCGHDPAQVRGDQTARPQQPVHLPVPRGCHAVSSPHVQPQMPVPLTAVVAQEAVSALVDNAVPAVPIRFADPHRARARSHAHQAIRTTPAPRAMPAPSMGRQPVEYSRFEQAN